MSVKEQPSKAEFKIEVGPGMKPAPGYDAYCDLHQTEYMTHQCHMDDLPFVDACAVEVRAYEVLEHQSYLLTVPTLKEWHRVLKPGGRLLVKVPNAAHYILAWVQGHYPMHVLNMMVMGGHTDQAVFIGYDEQHDVPRWLWNAHHALFDEQSLRDGLLLAGFHNISIDVGPDLHATASK